MANISKKDSKNKSFDFFNFCANNFIWIVILISLLILLFGFLFLIKPKYDKMLISVAEIDQKQDQFLDLIRDSKEYLGEVNELAMIYNSLNKDDFKKIDLILPSCGMHEELFTQMDNIIKKNGLVLDSISILPDHSSTVSIESGDPQVTSRQKRHVGISFGLGGVNYTGLKNFLNNIESNLRIMDVTSLSFDPNNNSIAIKIQTYCLN